MVVVIYGPVGPLLPISIIDNKVAKLLISGNIKEIFSKQKSGMLTLLSRLGPDIALLNQ